MEYIQKTTRCFLHIYDKVSISRQTYNKARTIYRRRGKVIKSIPKINILLNLPMHSKWYLYKGRILIFRPFHQIASFVIKDNKIYNPLIACGTICYFKSQDYPTTPIDIKIFTSKYYADFDQEAFLSEDKEQIFNILKERA